MKKCLRCGKGGLFKKINANGHCRSCEELICLEAQKSQAFNKKNDSDSILHIEKQRHEHTLGEKANQPPARVIDIAGPSATTESMNIPINRKIPKPIDEVPFLKPYTLPEHLDLLEYSTNTVSIQGLLSSPVFKSAKSPLFFALGKDSEGNGIYGDLAAMPHLLIAGTTGSGKSVCVNSIIISLLYKASPDELKFLMIDPKVVELRRFNGIPHMRTEVVTDPKTAPALLYKAVETMLYRYKLFANADVRDIDSYNEIQRVNNQRVMKKTVIVIDELADLMMFNAKEVEDSICRIAQLGRASGIHLIITTSMLHSQIVTDLIKANIPSRIALRTASASNSRMILNMSGAEKLLGKGDMLYMPIGQSKPIHLQGCFISDKENGRVIDFLKNAGLDSNYDEELTEEIAKSNATKSGKSSDGNFEDEMTLEAARLAIENEQISTSMLQRRLRLGYARAARIVDELEDCGIVSAMENNKREVLMTMPEFEAAFGENTTGKSSNDWD